MNAPRWWWLADAPIVRGVSPGYTRGGTPERAEYEQQVTDDGRAEHLAWCKQRALAYLDRGDLINALASFNSDMGKHPDTADYINSPAIAMLFAIEAVAAVTHNDPAALRRFIEGCK